MATKRDLRAAFADLAARLGTPPTSVLAASTPRVQWTREKLSGRDESWSAEVAGCTLYVWRDGARWTARIWMPRGKVRGRKRCWEHDATSRRSARAMAEWLARTVARGLAGERSEGR